MSDSGHLDVIETRQYIFNKVQTTTTLVEQCTDKQTLYLAWYHNRTNKMLFRADKTRT